jgi:voltage-gated potassium channel
MKNRLRRIGLKKAIYDLTNNPKFDLAIIFFILISIGLFFVDSVFTLKADSKLIVDYFEKAFTGIFIFEYLLRYFAARSKRTFFVSHFIDLLAIIPLFRFFRLFRVIRLLKFMSSSSLRRWLNAIGQKSQLFSFTFQDKVFEIVFVFSILVSLLFIGTIGILALEKGHNEQFTNFTDGLWWTVVTLTTVGYGDKFPITGGGKFLAIFLMFTGLSFFALITSFISSFIIERSRKGENRGMELATLSDHVVICGWNSNAVTVLKELDFLYSSEMKFKVVISELEHDLPLNNYTLFLNSDFTKLDSLEKARVSEAESVIILADKSNERSDQDIDARTILTVLGLKKKYPNLYICAEVISRENVEHIKNAGVDEFISSFEYTGNMLAHTVVNRGIAKVYSELLQSNVGNQLLKSTIDSSIITKKFFEASEYYSEKKDSVLIGIERESKFYLNPGHEFLIQENDSAILISKD